MQRHGGKRIRMDDPPPEVANYQQSYSNYGYVNYNQPDQIDYDQQHQIQLQMQQQQQQQQQIQMQMYQQQQQQQYQHPSPHLQQQQQPQSQQQTSYEAADGIRITRSRTRGGSAVGNAVGVGSGMVAASNMDAPSYNSSPITVHSPQSLQTSPRSVGSGSSDFFVPPAPVVEHRGRGRKPSRKGVAENTPEDEHSLYYLVKNNKHTLSKIVDDWTDFYKNSREDALLSLMNFFINSSGCKGKITKELQQLEHKDIIRIMTEEFDEDGGEYPVMMTAQMWKKFKSNFCDFIQLLIKRCQYSIIYDQYLMDNIISLLTGLSDSQVRAFRHTSTLAAMKMMTALVDVALAVSLNLETNQRQYQTEYQKNKDKRGSGPLESILAKRQELEENIDEIKNMLTYMFKSVFVHRYRDTVPDIRAIAMMEIGVWMYKFHSNFLDDSYLKYIGWTLYDKVGDVRLRCLQSLQPLYASEELKGKLELFTNKFKDRVVAMTLDKEYDVSVNAVKLVTSILKFNPEILTDKDCEHVYELVYSTHRGLAQAAGEFLNERLFQPTDVDPGKTLRGKPRLATTPLVRDLVQFFIESEFHEHGAYLVDSLIDSNPIVRDWECMTDLLLEEPGPTEEALDNQQETALIEIMMCSIRQTATGEPPVCRGPSRKTSHKEAKIVADDKKKLSEHFIKVLPQLLDKYISDSEKICNLVQIPQYFDLDLYTTNRQESSLLALLDKLKSIVKTQHDTEVLDQCAKTLEYLCGESHAVASRCEISRSTIIDLIVSNYKENYDDWKTVVLSHLKTNEDEKFNVVDSLKKVSIFFSLFDLNKSIDWPLLFHELKALTTYVNPDHILPVEGLIYLIKNCLLSILWYFNDIEEKVDNIDSKSCEELRQMLDEFVNILIFILGHTFTENLKEAAFATLCDFFIFFNYNLLSEKSPELAQLAYQPDDTMAEALITFIRRFVFFSDEEGENEENKIEELHNRRRYLAGFSKLISCNILPVRYAADIFVNYVKYYNEFGDIIKHLLAKTREICKVQCTATMCLSLQKAFLSLKELYGPGVVVKGTEELIALKELAKRFALSLGLDAVKNKQAVLRLHRDGILFAVKTDDVNDLLKPPPNIVFFEILAEFTNKLLKPDKKLILTFLDSQVTHGMPSNRPEEWQSLNAYRNSLIHGDSDLAQSVSKRTYIRKRKDNGDDEDQMEDSYLDDTM